MSFPIDTRMRIEAAQTADSAAARDAGVRRAATLLLRRDPAFVATVARQLGPCRHLRQVSSLDLAIAPHRWRAMADDEIRAEIARKGTPVRRIRLNGAPTLTSLHEAADDLLNGVDASRIVALYTASWTEVAASPHAEKRLYSGGFPSDADQQRMFDFHEATWRGQVGIAALSKIRACRCPPTG
jgi:hypothetical protein